MQLLKHERKRIPAEASDDEAPVEKSDQSLTDVKGVRGWIVGFTLMLLFAVLMPIQTWAQETQSQVSQEEVVSEELQREKFLELVIQRVSARSSYI